MSPRTAHITETAAPPVRLVITDDRTSADTALRHARSGSTLLWRGDYHNARHLLAAMRRRLDRPRRGAPPADPAHAFHRYRQARARRARLLSCLVVELGADYTLALRRAPDVSAACTAAYGRATGDRLVPLTELLGVLSAHQWRINGVEVPALGARIHPHYGVFAPTRNEYTDLVARAPVPDGTRFAVDLGTGTGVLAALLARRGVPRVLGTDLSPQAVACARENLGRLGLGDVEIRHGDLFPDVRADLIVCNPPWLPGTPVAALDHGVYDPHSAMLHGYLDGLADHLTPGGEGWLIFSDLSEHLGLRAPGDLGTRIAAAGLQILGRLDTRPRHRRAADPTDPLHTARAAETVTLWRLAPRSSR
ncbi:class I SAM-dependent methyltransferase [Nocardia wallacei]|uniref:class I SAM-dependent methyltransferase n=1 Tax=Nocardia wallacei TaxID=480035 RepID=UPI0024577605|nr:class I SAM-dependent methyltransferase [Nocardia wallacei]